MTFEAYDPNPDPDFDPDGGNCKHTAWVKNGRVFLSNDDDSYYEQDFKSRDALQEFVDHLWSVADQAWPDPDLCADIAEMLERLQEINPEHYAWWYSALYPTENPPGDEWNRYTLATLQNLVKNKCQGFAVRWKPQ